MQNAFGVLFWCISVSSKEKKSSSRVTHHEMVNGLGISLEIEK